MFQSFDTMASPEQGVVRVARLREAMRARGLDAVLVPRADEHQGEYVAARSERLQWLTGFTGSAGAAIIMTERAVLFVDGRYTLQGRAQTDPATFEIESLVETPPARWLEQNAQKGWRIGIDPWLHTVSEAKRLAAVATKAGVEIAYLEANPVDGIWEDQPSPPREPVEIHPLRFAGETAKDKLARLTATIREAGADYTILTDPSSVAWSFNLRGRDVPHTPLVLAFAIVAADGTHAIFIDERKLGMEQKAYLTQLATILPPVRLEAEIAARSGSGARLLLDPQLAAERLRAIAASSGGEVVEGDDPARLPRAMKNQAELEGARAAHRRDGLAVTRFLHWLDSQPSGSQDEISVAVALEQARKRAGDEAQMPLRDISFDTISGAGPNGAIIHYRVTTPTNRKLKDGTLYLVDSGGQYQDGTTDITRTVAIGAPSPEMRRHYTIVLKGLIGVSLMRFPKGTRGQDIDPIARIAHWKAGLDYAHGTGHGVGAFLAVHEGPQRIARTGSAKLMQGMILSNEPGYYKEGAYGIRLENLIVVTDADAIEGGEIPMHGFETLTLAPFDRRLIHPAMLTSEESDWLDAYHARVLAELGPMLDGEALAWLEAATAPLSPSDGA